MKVVIQRVSSASVTVEGNRVAEIKQGLLVLVGIEEADTLEDIQWLSSKIANLRIFGDADGVMNLSVKDTDGDIIVISQFTLQASTKKAIVLPISKRQNTKSPSLCMSVLFKK